MNKKLIKAAVIGALFSVAPMTAALINFLFILLSPFKISLTLFVCVHLYVKQKPCQLCNFLNFFCFFNLIWGIN